MREGELCSLLVKDFYPGEAYVHLEETKNGSSRDVPLSQQAIRWFGHLCQGKAKEDKIIPLLANTLCEYFGDAKKAAGLNHLVFHDTRHEATTLLSKKLSVLELASVTGHKDMKSLKRYYNPKPGELSSKLG
jgi:integrase